MHLYLADGVSAEAVEKYLKRSAENGIYIRAMQIVKGKEPMARVCFAPYDFETPMHLYSLSKSFTSTAVGICVDEGLLSPDTKMCELFADKMPENMTDALKKLRLHDLLSMQSGHTACVLDKIRWSDDTVKAFFEQPTTYEPGTTFAYSTAATCMCGAAVERVTGKKLVDFLDERLFSKLGIAKPTWWECRDGQTLGGTGLHLSSNDITKFGMMLKNKGIYNGERIVSEDYIKLATSKHSLDVNNGAPDWVAGYGYQFWLNDRDGFRGDGAFGQLCMVFPESDTLVTVMGEVGNMALEVEILYDLLDTIYGEKGETDSLNGYLETAYMPEKTENFNNDISFTVAENAAEVEMIRFFGEKLLHVELSTAYGKKEFVCGNGEYILNHYMLKNMTPSITFLDPAVNTVERQSVFASYKNENGRLYITLRHQNTCHVQHWTVDLEANTVNIHLHAGDIICNHLDLTPISDNQ
ncbi:MAG: beta-lactamase family protein [Ruminococcaceae bacterium]|nr:beta-lactamase family protein [Oscillospiraceae bacterium]